ncbi:MAG: tetratricopeptide repeat protein [Chloroflexota bacterium]
MSHENEDRNSEETFLIESALAEIYTANAGIGSVEAAESNLLGVLELDPNFVERVEAHNLLAQLYAQTGRHQEALDNLASALAAAPEEAATLSESLASMFEKEEEWELAIEVYRQGLACAEDAVLHNGIGYSLARANRFEEAEHHSRRAMELEPDNAAYANDLGYLLLEQGQVHEARTLFQRALQLDPSDELARGNLRRCSEAASESKDD